MSSNPEYVLPLSDFFDPREREVYAMLGEEVFRALVDAFYRRVADDPLLGPMFPKELAEAKERQRLFLIQYFGGPGGYSQRYGHPRLRLRHFPFSIGMAERDTWLGHMLAAIQEAGVPEPWAGIMGRYFERTSLAMMNRKD